MALAVARSLSLLRQKPSSTAILSSLSACLRRSQQHHNDNSRLPTSPPCPTFSTNSYEPYGLPISEMSLIGNNGLDFEHWLVCTYPPPEDASREQIIDSYIKTLAQVVGSEEDARMKIYSVSTRCYYAFGALVSEKLSDKLKELPNVRWVLPDSYLDADKKDYGGEPFIQGQAVPYDPKYHRAWTMNKSLENWYRARKNSSARQSAPLRQRGNRGRQSKPPRRPSAWRKCATK